MSQLEFYHIAPSRSSTVLWMLEEVGAPYDLKLMSMKRGENRQPDYLKINPMGKVPAIVHDGTVVTETGAVCLYLADAFPEAGLSVPLDDPRRGSLLRWIFFHHGSFEPAVMDKAFPRAEEAQASALPHGDYDTVMDVLAGALANGPWLLGEQFTAADVMMGSAVRWGLAFGIVPKREEFLRYNERVGARPAVQRAEARDEELKQL